MINSVEKVLREYNEILSEYSQNNLEKSLDFNVFDFISEIFWLDEPKHSRIIAFLLNPNGIHGQKNMFLNLFLKQLGMGDCEEGNWQVLPEKGNADILIFSTYPENRTIIIENKSNEAKDQDNQLYRYWYKHIYEFNQKNLKKSSSYQHNRMIYLSPHENKKFVENSICKPLEDFDDGPEKVPFKIDNWLFRIDLKRWLQSCKNEAQSDRMKDFIQDYINYWDETNFKHEFIMENLLEYFRDQERSWTDFIGASKKINDLKRIWITSFAEQLDGIKVGDWKFFKDAPDKELGQNIIFNDFRWFIKGERSFCFVYEYHKGLTIWNSESLNKEVYREKFNEIFSDDFDWIDDNPDYYMQCKTITTFEGNEDEFIWTAGNNPDMLVEKIKAILNKYCSNEVVVKLFNI